MADDGTWEDGFYDYWDLDQNYIDRVYGAADPVSKMVYWAYPGTGNKSCDNCNKYPVPTDSPNATWRKAATKALEDLKKNDPDLICVSAGFDAYKRDPLCQQQLEIEDFAWIARQLRQLNKPQANLLEGGYSNDLPKLIFAYLKGLA